ncbi:hypothetical protein [Pararhizobium sp. PWRC1-1]|uniref:hypothetical protein n=1 Tax=Pararhizobium sp. PWRC1-1 TaxID=2804566 RepID=UPI003CEB7B15
MNFTRRQIYDMVWSKPLSKIAVELGLSDQGLAKACRRFDVPVPPLGYWQKLAHGKAVEHPDLPRDQLADDVVVSVVPGVKMRPKQEKSTAASLDKRLSLNSALPTPSHRHPLVSAIEKKFSKAKVANEFTNVTVTPFKITASPLTTERVTSLIGQLLNAFEVEGWILQKREADAWQLLVNEEEITITITEGTTRVPYTPTRAELRDAQMFSWKTIPEFDLAPSGEIKFTIANASYLGIRMNWADGKKQKMETILPSFIEGIATAGAALHARRLEREERARQQKLWEVQEAERRRREQIQSARWGDLKQQALKHQEAEALRNYIMAVRSKLGELSEKDRTEVQAWIDWAEHSIQNLDPLEKGMPSMMSDDNAYQNAWRYRG